MANVKGDKRFQDQIDVMLGRQVKRAFPDDLRERLENLKPLQKDQFIRAFMEKEKNLVSAYLASAFLGCHHLYFRRPFKQLLFWITLGGLMIWWVRDILKMEKLFMDYNKKWAREVLVYMDKNPIVEPAKPSCGIPVKAKKVVAKKPEATASSPPPSPPAAP